MRATTSRACVRLARRRRANLVPLHKETRIVPYTADEMYAVVAEMERYPEFLPWCASLRVLKREKEDEAEIVTAEMVVAYQGLHECYVSRVRLDHAARIIEARHVEGPFKRLDTRWRFVPLAPEHFPAKLPARGGAQFLTRTAKPSGRGSPQKMRQTKNRERLRDSKKSESALGSEIHFLIDFAFKNRLLSAVAGVAFGFVAARMAEAFVKRADCLYAHTS